jgi:hypothetical protein
VASRSCVMQAGPAPIANQGTCARCVRNN